MRTSSYLLGLLLLHAAHSSSLFAAPPGEVVRLELIPSVQVTEGLVRIADVARLSGGSATARTKIAEQDIILLTNERAVAQVSRARVQIRLLLAGIDPATFELAGAPAVRIARGDPAINPAMIRAELLTTIASQFNADPKQFELTLTRAIEIPQWPVSPESSPRIVFYLPDQLKLGNLRTTAAIYDGATLLGKVEIYAQLGRYQMVPRTTRVVARNTPLDADNVRTERRLLTTGTGQEYAQTVIGRVTRRTLPAHALIRTRDIADRQVAEISIRSQTPVQLVARVGSVTVTMNNAIALQSGRVGDMIQVRNLESRTTHIGRITSGSRVEVITR